MKTVEVTSGQYHVLKNLSRRELATLRKYPGILLESKRLLRAFNKVIQKIEMIPEHASRRKRQTAHKRVIGICRKALDLIER